MWTGLNAYNCRLVGRGRPIAGQDKKNYFVDLSSLFWLLEGLSKNSNRASWLVGLLPHSIAVITNSGYESQLTAVSTKRSNILL